MNVWFREMIAFNSPHVPEISKRYVLEVLENDHQQGDGFFTAKASKLVSKLVGGGHVLLTPSCTHALEMASMLAGIGPGDEVILPSYTFTSAATAITKFGATPVFVDIEMSSKGIDVDQVRHSITPRTRAISWVNYAGVAPDIEGLQSLARDFNLLLIEDNAHGLGGTYKGKPLGSFGDFATQSFHATKNIQCGEGGALVINNSKFASRAEIIREKGTDRSRFSRGEVSKYQWIDKGSSYLLAESLAAQLTGQLESFIEIQERRISFFDYYVSNLSSASDVKRDFSIDMEFLNQESKVGHMFYILTADQVSRERLRERLMKKSIQATSHYQPLDSSPAGTKYGKKNVPLGNSREFSDRILRLPLHLGLDFHKLDMILEQLVSK
jgi:dTDP-4-amino-4,6-dideoxygalactose transaminase